MASKSANKSAERKIRGVIVPVAWLGGRVTEAAISARDEKVYLVVDQDHQKWLQENLHREIQAFGPVTTKEGERYLTIRRWMLIDPGWADPLEGNLPPEPVLPGSARTS